MLGYTGINYFPQAIAINIAKMLNASVLDAYRLGQLLQQIAGSMTFALSLHAALNFSCWSGIFGTVLMSLPMTLHLVSSFSGDALVIESAIILAIILEILIRQTWQSNLSTIRRSRRPDNLLLTAAVGILFSYACLISKASYLPSALTQALASIYYLHLRQDNTKKYAITLSVLTLVGLIAVSFSSLHWLNYTTESMRILFDSRLPIEIQSNRQFQVSHFSIAFVRTIFKTLILNETDLWRQLIGNLGSLNKPLARESYYTIISLIISLGVFVPLGLGLLTGLAHSSRTQKLSILTAVLLFIGLASSAYLVLGAIWTTWTSEQSLVVEGVQGRHFLPLLPSIPVITLLIGSWLGGRIQSFKANAIPSPDNWTCQAGMIISALGISVNFKAYIDTVNFWYGAH